MEHQLYLNSLSCLKLWSIWLRFSHQGRSRNVNHDLWTSRFWWIFGCDKFYYHNTIFFTNLIQTLFPVCRFRKIYWNTGTVAVNFDTAKKSVKSRISLVDNVALGFFTQRVLRAPLSVSFPHCSIIIFHSSITHVVQSYQLTALLTLNIPSLARQRCLPSWGPRRTPWFFL